MGRPQGRDKPAVPVLATRRRAGRSLTPEFVCGRSWCPRRITCRRAGPPKSGARAGRSSRRRLSPGRTVAVFHRMPFIETIPTPIITSSTATAHKARISERGVPLLFSGPRSINDSRRGDEPARRPCSCPVLKIVSLNGTLTSNYLKLIALRGIARADSRLSCADMTRTPAHQALSSRFLSHSHTAS